MPRRILPPVLLNCLLAALLLSPVGLADASSAAPGETVRDMFGPAGGGKPSLCRGACGSGCPGSCEVEESYECSAGERLTRVMAFTCGTHQGCREHDDCLDGCLRGGGAVGECSQRCDAEAIETFGLGAAGAWMLGKGPFDGHSVFEYTRDAAGAPAPAFRCPEGAQRQCKGRVGCIAAGTWVDPVFDSYPEAGAGAMRISAFVAGPACGGRVCRQARQVEVTGDEACAAGPCTRFGMEFDYRNADGASPLLCTTSTSAENDFIGGLLKQGADAMESRGTMPDPESEDGLQALVGLFGKVLASADSPEDLNVSIAPLDEEGNPVESERVGSGAGGPPPIPHEVALPGPEGHVFVPMYQLRSGMSPGQVKERRVRCTHRGEPVLDTRFVLRVP